MKFIFEVRIKPGYAAEKYADAWIRVSEIIQRAPGARGTRLHRKIGDPNVLLAIASWDSKADRDAMDESLRNDAVIKEILGSQREYCEIHLLGEFEEPQWVVLPPGREPAQDA